jgi:hypothetical protein
MTQSISVLKDKYKGQVCTVVGKGLSIAALSENDFRSGPVITLNEAILFVEKLKLSNDIYSIQKDGCGIKEPHNKCAVNFPIIPKRSSLLIGDVDSKYCLMSYEPRYEFSEENDFGYDVKFWQPFSAMMGVRIAQYFGCNKIKMMCFDAVVMKNISEWNVVEGTIKDHSDYIEISRILFDYTQKISEKVVWITPKNYNENIHTKDFFFYAFNRLIY